MTQLFLEDGIDNMAEWTKARDISVFKQKILLFPFHSDCHWSLFAVVNPGIVRTAHKKSGSGAAIPCILYFDSLGSRSGHRADTVSGKLRLWLNRCWKLQSDNPYENCCPFSKYTLRCHRVKVPPQSNNYDAGMHLVRNVHGIVNLSNEQFTRGDLTDVFKSKITLSEPFQYHSADIHDLREQAYRLTLNVRSLYQTNCPSSGCNNSSLSVNISDDSNVEMASVDSDDNMSNAESKSSDESYEDPGVFSSSTKRNDTHPSLTVYPGFQISYKIDRESADTTDTIVVEVVVNNLSEIGCSIFLSNGYIIESADVHMAVIKFQVPGTKRMVTNPEPIWDNISRFRLAISRKKLKTMKDKDHRSKTSAGKKRYMHKNHKKAMAKKKARRSKPVPLPAYAQQFKGNPTMQRRIVKKVNEKYKQLLNYGKRDRFYESQVLHEATKDKYDVVMRRLNDSLRDCKREGRVQLNLPEEWKVRYTDIDNPSTIGDNDFEESIFMFEHKMKCQSILVCPCCRENVLEEIASEKMKSEYYTSESVNWACSSCRKLKNMNYYLEHNLHPIWYECDEHGNRIKGDDGKHIIRYDIPTELSSLTMPEQLLIRRYAPIIPTRHIRNSNYGIQGNCVAFPQLIDSVCDVLPRRKEAILTFIRQQKSNQSTGTLFKHHRINRVRVLTALRWLKRHHVGYRDITIKEDNFWFDEEEFDTTKDAKITEVLAEDEVGNDGEEFVSREQVVEPDTDIVDEFEMSTMHANEKKTIPCGEETEPIKELINAANESGHMDKALKFPPIDPNPVS